ncbi:MAG TPA: hypothetical protein VFT16_05140 [Candidatus Saccharimonadales bacterium]|nr:hypothetical protein [Candidatus Saccharimonadales bacterium]
MRYFLGFLASIGLVILVFFLVLRGLGGNNNPAEVNPLTDYANTDAIVRMTVDGPIVADEQHQAYRITVGRSETRIETLQGYQYSTIDSKTYPNNQEGYTNFLRALDIAGFSKGNPEADSQAEDERGVCAFGSRFVYEIVKGTSQIQRYWATSCGGQGTFKGSTENVKRLFDKQVPTADYAKMVSRLRL